MKKNINYTPVTDDLFGGNEKLFIDTWMKSGWFEAGSKQLEIKDMLATPNANYWMPRTIEEIVREPVEPLLIVTGLFDRIAYTPSLKITYPAAGALVAYDLGEDQAYPEQTLNIAPGSMTVNVGKTGLAFRITEEMIRYSQFDLINMHIRQARKALDRWKEQKGMNYIDGMGVCVYDNVNPSESVYGVCTGRNAQGAGNGSMRMEDMLKGYSMIMMQGYVPDTILMHPLTWSIWMTDPLLQAITKNTGNGSWFQPMNMAKQGLPWANASQGKQGMAGGYGKYTPAGNVAGETPTALNRIDQNLRSTAVIPGYFPYPLRVLVSPFVPYDINNETATIMMFDSSNLGAYVVDEDVMVDEWEDKSVDARKIKLRERYCFAIYNEGDAVAVFRNIPIAQNEIAFPVQPMISSAGSITPIDPTTAISGL